MNKIEKVAKALYRMFDVECDCNRCLHARVDARAAIEAMREPTEEMFEAGDGLGLGPNCDTVYSAMIDAALKE